MPRNTNRQILNQLGKMRLSIPVSFLSEVLRFRTRHKFTVSHLVNDRLVHEGVDGRVSVGDVAAEADHIVQVGLGRKFKLRIIIFFLVHLGKRWTLVQKTGGTVSGKIGFKKIAAADL